MAKVFIVMLQQRNSAKYGHIGQTYKASTFANYDSRVTVKQFTRNYDSRDDYNIGHGSQLLGIVILPYLSLSHSVTLLEKTFFDEKITFLENKERRMPLSVIFLHLKSPEREIEKLIS